MKIVILGNSAFVADEVPENAKELKEKAHAILTPTAAKWLANEEGYRLVRARVELPGMGLVIDEEGDSNGRS